MSLLFNLKFDEYPFILNPSYGASIKFKEETRISSVVEYMITKYHTNGLHILIFFDNNVAELGGNTNRRRNIRVNDRHL